MAGFGAGSGKIYSVSQYLDRNDIIIAIFAGVLFSMPLPDFGAKIRQIIKLPEPEKTVIHDVAGYVFTNIVFLILAVLVVMNLAASSYNPFIYFRF